MSTISLCSKTIGIRVVHKNLSLSSLCLSPSLPLARWAQASPSKFALPNIQTRTPQPLTRCKAFGNRLFVLQSLCISATSFLSRIPGWEGWTREVLLVTRRYYCNEFSSSLSLQVCLCVLRLRLLLQQHSPGVPQSYHRRAFRQASSEDELVYTNPTNSPLGWLDWRESLNFQGLCLRLGWLWLWLRGYKTPTPWPEAPLY